MNDANPPSNYSTGKDVSASPEAMEALKVLLEKAEHERDEYRKLYELVFLELERIRRHVFGKKSEKVPDEQLSLNFLEVASLLQKSEAPEDPNKRFPSPNSKGKGNDEKPKKRKPHGRRTLPEHLPIERIELPAPPEVETNPELFRKIGEDVSETLEWRPSSMVRVQIVRPKYAERGNDAAGIISSELPTKPIDKGLAGPGMLSHVIVSKYADHLPLHRLERIIARQQVELSRSTMCGWIEQCGDLAKCVVDAMWKDSMNAYCLATDATGVLVQAPGQCWRAHIFVVIADHDHVLYRYKRHHDGDAINDLFGDYKGNILSDAHPIYDMLYKNDSRIEFGCMSHARRYFYESLSTDPERGLKGIKMLRPLFKIEKKIKGKPPDLIKEVRQKESKPIVKEFFEWCDEQWMLVIEETPIHAAFRYARNQRDALSRFLDDGRIPMHNNFSELKLRHEKVGTKNWLFFGSEDGGQWNCTFNSLIASCTLHEIEPWSYIRDLLILLPNWKQTDVLRLSPKFWYQTLEQTDAKKILDANPFRKISVTR